MTRPDNRSVGELLLEADSASRRLLLHAPHPDPATFARTFGEVVEAAADLWNTLPRDPNRRGGRVIDTLNGINRRIHHGHLSSGWPGPGDSDPELAHIADQFTHAADLVRRHGRQIRLDGGAVDADIEATKTRTAHVMYVTGHAVALSVRRGLLRVDAGDPEGEALAAAMQATLRRLELFERTAGQYAVPGLITKSYREVVPPTQDLIRLEDALADWSSHAHRALREAPTAATVVQVCRTQADLQAAAAILVRAAEYDGALRPANARALRETLEHAHAAWAGAAATWQDLTHGRPTVDAGLAQASAMLQAALRAIAHNGPTWATADIIASRVDLGEVSRVIDTALAEGPELAESVAKIATRPDLAMSARVAAVATREPGALIWGASDLDACAAVVAPRDAHANRVIKLPAAVRQNLIGRGEALTAVVARCAASSATMNRHAREHVPRGLEGHTAPAPRRSPVHKVSGPLPRAVLR